MPRRLIRVLALSLAGAALGLAGWAAAAGIPFVQSGDDVTLCHATGGSAGSAYVQLSVPIKQIFGSNGHDTHPDDIIPPFTYVDDSGTQQTYPGKNWPDKEPIFSNGCGTPTTTSIPTTPTDTTSTTPTDTTSTTPTDTTPTTPTPLPVQPLLKCVDDNGGTFSAVFGYTNQNTTEVTVPIGAGNAFSPAPEGRNQPESFLPTTVESAVTVTGNAGETVTWTVTVGGVASSASASASFETHCSTEPPPDTPAPIEPFVKCVDNTGGTFSATFNYESSATDTVTIPVGSANFLDPAVASPPSTFDRGSHDFTVTGIANGTSLVWTLTTDQTRTATATADFGTKCTPPAPTPKPIAVSVTCIADHGASFDATFGYVNPNADTVSIPAGPDNDVTVGGASLSAGQPTTFQPNGVGTFTVTGVRAGADVTWTVRFAGVTSAAVANEASPHCGVDPPNPPGPYRIGIFVSCVTNDGATYSATFGYSNEDTQAKTVPLGDANRFLPAPENRGQPTTFQPGNVQSAVTVTGIPSGTSLVWSLTSDQTRSAEAFAGFGTKCEVQPPEPPEPPPAELVPIGLFVTCVTNHGGTFDAVFGYVNDNRAEQIVPLGLSNTFAPAPGNRGQPTTFEPGTVRNAVTVTGIPNGTNLAWSVTVEKLRVAVANENIPQKCSEPPRPPDPPPPEPTPPPKPPDPTPPPPDPKPPDSGLDATCVLTAGSRRTFTAIFGYVNASQKDVTIPVGRLNFVRPAPINRGQPSVFRPGVVPVAFTVRNVPRSKELTWTVTIPDGQTRSATASARFPRNCITAPAPPSADLVLQKTVRGDGRVTAGDRVIYTISVANRGPNVALRVRIVDVVDARLELLSASTTRGGCATAGRRVTCAILQLPPGVPVVVVIATRARGAGTIPNVAVVRHSRRDPTPGNNVGRAVVVVTGETGGVKPAFTG